MCVRRLGEGSSNITSDYKNSIENNFLIKFQNFCRKHFLVTLYSKIIRPFVQIVHILSTALLSTTSKVKSSIGDLLRIYLLFLFLVSKTSHILSIPGLDFAEMDLSRCLYIDETILENRQELGLYKRTYLVLEKYSSVTLVLHRSNAT